MLGLQPNSLRKALWYPSTLPKPESSATSRIFTSSSRNLRADCFNRSFRIYSDGVTPVYSKNNRLACQGENNDTFATSANEIFSRRCFSIYSCICCTASICSCMFSPPNATILQQCASISLDHFCSLPIGMLWNRPAEPSGESVRGFGGVVPVRRVRHHGAVCAWWFRRLGCGCS